jgi:tetratricopeptide (TPR) repeat protein
MPLLYRYLIVLSLFSLSVSAMDKAPLLVKFIIPNTGTSESVRSLPVFLALPDSLCGIFVPRFMAATKTQAAGLAENGDKRCLEKNPAGRRFLALLRAMGENRVDDAVDYFLALRKSRMPARLKYCVQLNEAVFKYMLGDTQSAEKRLLYLLDKYPWKEASWKNLFSLYMARGRYQKADELVESILANSPKTLWAQEYKINLIQMLGTRSDLIQYLKAKSSWRDSLFAIQIAYARLLKEDGEYHRAVKYFNRGLEGNPKNGDGWLELAEIHFKQDNLELARKCLSLAIKAGINNPLYFEILSHIIRDRIWFYLQRRRLYENDKQICFYVARPGACMREFNRMSEVNVDSNLVRIKSMLEEAFVQGMNIRRLAHTLYFVYGALGWKNHAENLRTQFSFHFTAPYPKRQTFGQQAFPFQRQAWLATRFSTNAHFWLGPLLRYGFPVLRVETKF